MVNEKDMLIWESRRVNITLLLSQTLGIYTILFMPRVAVIAGAAGHVIVYSLIYIVIGIPLLYMENVVGQFTGRDCIDVWKARPCLTHFAYIHITWQILYVIYLYTINSFVVHFFLISFENPIPFYICGIWSREDCNILSFNYTVNQDCLKINQPSHFCSNLSESFPEYQYWRFNILGLHKNAFYLPWRVGLASGLVAHMLFLSFVKGIRSLKWALIVVTVVPTCGRILFMIGSMLQKGVVVKFENAFDTDFSIFIEKFSLSNSIAYVLYTLNVGTGLSFLGASKSTFRAPCYSNTVIVVVITCCVALLGIVSISMMTCPYAFRYKIDPSTAINYPISPIFESVPRLLNDYEQPSLWLIITYSFIAISALSLNISIMATLMEIVSKRFPKVARNPGLTTFAMTVTMYIGTIPLLANMTLYFVIDIKNIMNVMSIFMVTCEIFVFVLWYGLEKFSEDVHFMQGVQPKSSVKACWLLSGLVLIYVLCTQLFAAYHRKDKSIGSTVAWYFVLTNIVLSILVTIVKLFIALYKKNLYEQLSLDSEWGPKSEVLRRSRAMFSAQAMTKEYMYRQYHLQAGILKRQQRSNIRNKQGMARTEGVRFDIEK